MKKVLMLASVASMIDQFNMQNIAILQELGYSVDVAANFEQGSTSSNDRMEKFKNELKEKNISYFQIDFSRDITKVIQNIKAYKQVEKLLKDNKYEFIHCHSPIGGVCGRIASRITGTKVIYTAHGFHFYNGGPIINWMIYYPIEKICSYFTDVLITINNEDYKLANKKMKAKQVYYVPGVGVDTEKFKDIVVDKDCKRKELGISNNDIMLLSVGELSKRKNHEVIIKALSKIEDGRIHYFIAGRGELENYLIDLAKSIGVEERVHLLGFRIDIQELVKVADIFCFPSKQEGLPVALMEAMASGLPCICSKIRGNSDLIKNKEGGYLCNDFSVEEFSSRIGNLSTNKRLIQQMSDYNKSVIKLFDVNTVNSKIRKIYKNLSNI
ncbi:glycosyltransferase family 4 protein [Paraclostridium bifermentans]|uniref:glycosyltransferase family 4 protein n=1 Tax=Paraclostridium bifermentans TaxID=1490 RepID=UPI0022E24166|nr:glycosyltransferase family 4 protein [Paraclostridium bifermentans]